MTAFYIIMAIISIINLLMMLKSYGYMRRSWECNCELPKGPKLEYYKEGIVIKNKKGKDVIRAAKPLEQ